jgi:hypothetical protein
VLASAMPNDPYRTVLIDYACAGPGLPAELVADIRRFQAGA